VNKITFGTEGASFKNESIFVDVSSITLFYKYPAETDKIFLISSDSSKSKKGIGYGG